MGSGRTRETVLEQQEISGILGASPLLSKLSGEQLQRVARHAKINQLADGDALFSSGDKVGHFYLVVKGRIKLFLLSPDGQEKILEIFGPGQTFAEALMFLDKPYYPVNATALGEARVIAVDAPDFADMLRDSVDTCFLIMGYMSQRLRTLVQEIDNLSLSTGTCRVAAYLLESAPEGEDEFVLEVPKGVIAARLSIKPETLSRIIKALTGQGAINVSGNKVQILDRDALRDCAKGPGTQAKD